MTFMLFGARGLRERWLSSSRELKPVARTRSQRNFKIFMLKNVHVKLTCTRDSVNPIRIAISSLMKMSRATEVKKSDKVSMLMEKRFIDRSKNSAHLDNESCWSIARVRSTELAWNVSDVASVYYFYQCSVTVTAHVYFWWDNFNLIGTG